MTLSPTISSFALTAATAVLASAPTPAQQRPLVDLSTTSVACQDASISPDGQFVAYRSGGSLTVDRTGGGAAQVVVTSSNLGPFLWSPAGGTLYVLDGNQVVAASRSGGGATNLGIVPGQSVWLWDVDSTNSFLLGTRFDPATSEYHIFRMATSGGQAPIDLVTSQDELSDVDVDPTDAWLLYLQRAPVPFAPYSLMRSAVDGSGATDMRGAPIGLVAQGPRWIDGGDRAVLVGPTPLGSLQLLRIDRLTQSSTPLTWAFVHQRPTVSADGSWVVLAAVDGVGGTGPALVPVEGGGEVLLYTGEGFSYAGSPRLDGRGTAVVFSARRGSQPGENARALKLELDGELRVHPRAEIGGVVLFDLPCSSTEFGAVLLGQRSAPVTLAGIAFDYDLGPSFAILGLGAGRSSGPLTFPLPIPFAASLQGLVIDFQGLRYSPGAQSGEWTRSGRLPIF
ncbi:MAG: hypothetical protein ACO3RU_15925 [Planctomycetota bacterium]